LPTLEADAQSCPRQQHVGGARTRRRGGVLLRAQHRVHRADERIASGFSGTRKTAEASSRGKAPQAVCGFASHSPLLGGDPSALQRGRHEPSPGAPFHRLDGF
jgi:hypothetical protein